VVTIISDVVVALIPIPVLLKLNVSRSKKLGLIGIFLLGLFTTICSIQRYLQIDRIQFGDGNSTMLVLWGVIEFNVGVSLPLFLWLITFIRFSFFSLPLSVLCIVLGAFCFSFCSTQCACTSYRSHVFFLPPFFYITRAG